MTRVLLAAAIGMALSAMALSAQKPKPAPAQPPGPNCSGMAAALQVLDSRLRDWPNLARYRDANAKLGAPAAGQSRVVFIGDSIIDEWPRPKFGRFFPGKPYVVRGIAGQQTPQMLIRFRPDVIDLKPKVVVILAGTNDIAANFGPTSDQEIEGNIQSMAELAKANGIKVVLSSILPTAAYHPPADGGHPQTRQRPMSRIKAINDWMKSYAAANGHVYLDCFTPMLDAAGLMKAELTTDDVHPNAKGYAIMAPLTQAAIDKALRGTARPKKDTSPAVSPATGLSQEGVLR